MLKIDSDKCKGCSLCIKSCPTKALTIVDKIATVDLDLCTLCGSCESTCPFGAIERVITKQAKEDLSQYKGVWVFGEQRNGKVAEVVLELIGIGRKLADDKGCELCNQCRVSIIITISMI